MSFTNNSVRVPTKELLENQVEKVRSEIVQVRKTVGSNYDLTSIIDRIAFDLNNVFLGLSLGLPKDRIKAQTYITGISVRLSALIKK